MRVGTMMQKKNKRKGETRGKIRKVSGKRPGFLRLFVKPEGKMDGSLLALALGFIVFGVIMVFSASAPWALREYGDPNFVLKRDLVWGTISIFVLVLVSRIPYRIYRRYAYLLYILAFILCILCFVPGIRVVRNGAHRWIGHESFTIMPSDFLKIGSIMFLSRYLSKRNRAMDKGKKAWKSFFFIVAFIGITILPVLLQPNFSAVMVISISLSVLFFVGGMKIREIIPLALFALAGLLYAFWPREGNYRLNRLLVMLDPMKDPLNEGWQLMQSLFAVTTGGLFGVGFGQSRQKFDYLADEPHNDFIFAVLSEELGFIGSAIFIIFYAYMIYRMAKAVRNCPNRFGQLLGFGLTFIIAFQAMVNIGVAIGLVPPTGITLPFISYGGSSLLAVSMMMGIILNISREAVQKPVAGKSLPADSERGAYHGN